MSSPNPVLDHLVRSRLEEHQQSQAQRDAEVARIARERLNVPAPQPAGGGSAWQTFIHYCAARGLTAFPATPPTVALFCADNSILGIDRLLQIVEAISAAHSNADASDPTLGPLVVLALDQIAPVKPPRSWCGPDKLTFLQMPRQIQAVVADREANRETTLRQTQQDRTAALGQLKAIQKEKLDLLKQIEAMQGEISALNTQLQKSKVKLDGIQSETAAA